MIDDKAHLDRVLASIVDNVAALGRAWHQEDEAACAPSGQPEGPSGSDPSDPTRRIATERDAKYRQRDHVGDQIMHVHATVKRMVEDRKPRTPSGPCNCCRNETATHGGLCLKCHDFLRARKFPCDDRIHEERGGVRWCQCDGGCCPDGCDDRAAEGRMVSDRCRQRQTRSRAA